ncbi:MAG TPA: cell division protein FtsL [Candidatus Binatia bacterium]
MALALAKKLSGLTLLKKSRPRPVRAAGRRRFLAPALLGLGLMAMALLHVWLRLQVVHLGYVLSTTSKLERQLEQENRELKVELATLTSPQRLEAMARSRLGMVEPARAAVVVLP